MFGSSLVIIVWNSWAVSLSPLVGDAEWKFSTKVFMANSSSECYRVGIVSDSSTVKKKTSIIDRNRPSGLSEHIEQFRENGGLVLTYN